MDVYIEGMSFFLYMSPIEECKSHMTEGLLKTEECTPAGSWSSQYTCTNATERATSIYELPKKDMMVFPSISTTIYILTYTRAHDV